MRKNQNLNTKEYGDTYGQLVAEYQWAQGALQAGDGDPDLLWMRWQAARRALDVFIQSVKQEQRRPVHDHPIVWSWWINPTTPPDRLLTAIPPHHQRAG